MWRYTRRAVVALSSHIWLMLPRTLAGWSVLIAAVTAACGFCFLAVVIHRAQVSLLCDSSAACPSAGCILCPARRSSTHCALLCRVRQDREEEWTGPRPKGPINKTSSEWRALATGSPHGTRSRKRACAEIGGSIRLGECQRSGWKAHKTACAEAHRVIQLVDVV